MNEQKQAPPPEQPKVDQRPPLRPIGLGMLPVQEIVNRLEELVRYVLECETKPVQKDVSFVDVYKRLVQIREAINVLSKDQQTILTILEARGISKEQMDKALSPEEKKIISKLKNLEGICEAAKERLHRSIQRHPELEQEIKEKIRSETATKKQKIIHRKEKFRRLGGKKGWLPT
jgi:chemotaxis protein histidine kinase CheA